MLHLQEETRASWLPEALDAIDEILLDHAHCEKKAASTAINLLFRYPDKTPLLAPLSALAREELAHFELVLKHLNARSIPFRRLSPSPYAAELMKGAHRDEPARLLDTLVCCALIEGRSCERMRLLSEGLVDREPELAALYRGLLASEARHHRGYLDLAEALFPKDEVAERLRVLAAHEAEVLATPGPEPRVHS
ncbi:MAG: tRNA-(ms[2]io[6]A)-hydroxylase [Myxococcota bacterium]|nr:tRNA-(ms[2]io[6]A)-hydroxylase [Myxococcota bacterium]